MEDNPREPNAIIFDAWLEHDLYKPSVRDRIQDDPVVEYRITLRGNIPNTPIIHQILSGNFTMDHVNSAGVPILKTYSYSLFEVTETAEDDVAPGTLVMCGWTYNIVSAEFKRDDAFIAHINEPLEPLDDVNMTYTYDEVSMKEHRTINTFHEHFDQEYLFTEYDLFHVERRYYDFEWKDDRIKPSAETVQEKARKLVRRIAEIYLTSDHIDILKNLHVSPNIEVHYTDLPNSSAKNRFEAALFSEKHPNFRVHMTPESENEYKSFVEKINASRVARRIQQAGKDEQSFISTKFGYFLYGP